VLNKEILIHLFFLAINLLQKVLSEEMIEGIIFPPLNRLAYLDFLVIQYADDTLVITKVHVAQLLCFKLCCTLLFSQLV
jgi:hypothetical protein